MLKKLTIIGGTILILTAILVVRYDEIHNTEGKGYDIKCTQSSEPAAAVDSLICTAEHSQQAKSGESDSPWWHVFFTWPEGITALLIMLTLVAISVQTWETRKAAKATQAGAKATAEQSENMVARKRARLSIIFPSMEPQIDDIKIMDVDGAVSQYLELYIEVINDGESKAFNVAASGYVMIEAIELGKAYASHGAELTIPKIIREADITNPVRVHLARSGLGDKVSILSNDWKAVQSGDKSLHMVGTISYDDVYGRRRHHTPFWYTWKIEKDTGNWGEEAEW